MYSESQIRTMGDALFDVVSEMVERDVRGDYHGSCSDCPFDIQPENFHRRKSDFDAELKFLRRWLADMEAWQRALELDEYPGVDDDDLHRLTDFMNGWAKSDAKYDVPATGVELAVSNVLRTGLVPGLLLIFERTRPNIERRIELLEEQQGNYWSVSHRPPNYHARTVALRLARLYAQEKRERPTIGLSAETGDPSTKYGRALRRTFDILGIDADFRAAGEWAVAEITEEDINRAKPKSALDVLRHVAAAGYIKKRLPDIDL